MRNQFLHGHPPFRDILKGERVMCVRGCQPWSSRLITRDLSPSIRNDFGINAIAFHGSKALSFGLRAIIQAAPSFTSSTQTRETTEGVLRRRRLN